MPNKTKGLIAALVLSLAMNVFVAGVVLGKGMRPPPPPRAEAGIDFNLRGISKHLTPEDRRKVRVIVSQQRKQLRSHFQEIKASENSIKALMSAETLDRSALSAALEAHGALTKKMRTPMQELVVDIIAGLDQETRQKVAADMFRLAKRRHLHRDGMPPRPQ